MAYTDSDPVTTDLAIRGVWIHDPDDPEGTLRMFPYGANQRGDSFDPMAVGTFYAGQEDPVFDFGDSSGSSIDVSIDVPHGADFTENVMALRQFAALKKNLWYRDNRSRAIFGTIGNFKVSDQGYGAQITFTFTKAHRAVESVVVA